MFDFLKKGDVENRKKKYRPVYWTAQAKDSFIQLKEALTKESVLSFLDTERPFTIETDASE